VKYIHCDGVRLEVRDIGEVIYALEPLYRSTPLTIITHKIVDDDTARLILQQIKENIPVKRTK
jgi:hypothetical protein